MTGGYLRTNFRREGGNSMTALANGYANTSYAGGAGLNKAMGGGLIFGSATAFTTLSMAIALSAYGEMSAFFGGGVFTSGYQMKIVAFNLKYVTLSSPGLFASNSGSIVYVYAGGSTALNITSTFSASFEYTALIISAP
jgi:hypothetical protein